MSRPNYSHNQTDPAQPSESGANDLPETIIEETGYRGGVVEKTVPGADSQPISLVDYLWRHRND